MSHPSSWQAGDTDLQNRYRRFSKLAATKSRSRGDRRIVRATSVTTVSNIWNGALRRKAPCSKGALRTPLPERSEEHTSELQSLMRISYAAFCLKNKRTTIETHSANSTSISLHMM